MKALTLRFLLAMMGGVMLSFGQIKFDKTSHDFGKFPEGTEATHVFKFTNTGEKNIRLTRVSASCGCTTPHWTREEVKPGGTGEIKVVYNSKGRVGMFSKSITVQYEIVGSDQRPNPIVLHIKGEAVRDPNAFPEVDGNVAFKTRSLNVGEIRSNQTTNFSFELKNIGQKPIKLLDAKTLPMFKVLFNPEIVHPNQKAQILVTYLPEKAKESGYSVDQGLYTTLTVITDDEVAPNKQLIINGRFKRVYTKEEIENSPKIVFEKTEFDGGDILQGQKLVYDFKFRNEGKSDLVIENVRASCGCTASAADKKIIKPGESSYIHVEFNSTGKQGMQHKTVTVTSNDVNNPRVVLHVRCNVVKDAFSAPGPNK